VQWRINGFHTVTLPRRGNRPPEFVVPDPANPVSGVVDAAGAPFWFNGQPRFIANPLVAFKQGGGAYTGRRLLNSGVPAGAGAPPPYTVRFPATGTYRYYCAIHVGNPDMQGTVRVVSGRRSIPSAAETRREASRQFARAIVQVKRDDRFAGPQGNAVAAGVDSPISTLFRFRPATKTVKAGTTVTWQMPQRSNEAHTVTFGPPDFLHTQAEALITPAAGGVLAVNPLRASRRRRCRPTRAPSTTGTATSTRASSIVTRGASRRPRWGSRSPRRARTATSACCTNSR
jgi:plastocyanin